MKKGLVFLALILSLIICATTVFAADKMELDLSKTDINVGEEFVVSVNFGAEEAFYAYTAKLNYDKDVFELIEKEDFQEQDNWSDITYSNINNKFALINKTGEQTNKLVNIKMKVKEDAKLGNTTITVNSASASNGKESKTLESASKEIKVTKNGVVDETPQTQTNVVDEDISIKTEKQFPWLSLLLIVLSVIIALALMKLLPMFKLEKKTKTIIIAIGVVLIFLLLTLSIKNIDTKEADINGNGSVNYDDSTDLMEYILEIKNPSEEELPNLDVNNDGKIDVTDVAITTQEVKKQSTSGKAQSGAVSSQSNSNNNDGSSNGENPSSSDTNTGSENTENPTNPDINNGDENGENPSTPEIPDEPQIDYQFKLDDFKVVNIDRNLKEITLQFTSTNATEGSTEAENYYVNKVTINGKDYGTTKSGSTYTVIIPYEEDKKTVLELQTAELNNSHQFKNLNKSVVVFKEAPTAELSTQIDDNLQTIKAQINIVNKESILNGLEIRLVDSDGKTIITKQIDENTKEISLDTENDIFTAGKYTVEIGADYDAMDGLPHNSKEAIATTEVTVKTKAKIVSAEVQNYYVEKGKDVVIKYKFISNNKYNPSGVTINNTFYPLTDSADGFLTAIIPAETSGYGIKKHSVSIAMFGEETVNLDSTQDAIYYLLKEKPSIEKYVFNEFVKKQTLEFGLKNSEAAIIKDARVILTNEEDEKVLDKPLNTSIEKGKETAETTIELSELPNGIYTVSIAGTYDLDDDESNNLNTGNLADIFEPKQIQVTSTYSASLYITNVEIKETEAVVTFTSTNSSNANIEFVVVDGTKYPIEKQGDSNIYTVKIPHENEKNQTKKITAVIIGNDIDIDLDLEQTYEVFKEKPVVSDIQVQEEENNLSVNFKFTDKASIAKNAKVVLKKGDFSQQQPITSSDTNVVFEGVTSEAGTYTIEFLADYDRADGKNHTQERIGSTTYEVPIKITSIYAVNPKYVKKDEDVAITYQITSNTNEPVTELTVDGVSYPISNGYCTINVKAPQQSGEKTYELTNIKYGDKSIDVSQKTKVFVLKDAPTIKDFKLDKKGKLITFYLENPDEAKIDGKLVIKDLNGEVVYSQDLQNKENKIDLSQDVIDETATYQVVLEGTYDLDDDLENGENQASLEDFVKEEFQLRISTEVNFESFSTRYIEKGKDVSIDITFKVKSNTSIPVTAIYINGSRYDATDVTPEGSTSDEKLYKITYSTKEDNSGVKELTVKNVEHGIEDVTVDTKTDKIEVLKTAPKVKFDYEIHENYEEGTITFTFTLEDPDGIIGENGAYVVYANGKFHDANGQSKIYVKPGKQTVTFVDVEKEKGYLLEVKANYDLDTNALNDILNRDDNKYENARLLGVMAILLPPKRLEISNITAQNQQTGMSSKYLNKNEDFKLSFTSKTFVEVNGTEKPILYYPVSAVINGKTYKLIKDGDTYTTEEVLTGYDEAGKKSIKITSVTLSNNEVIEEDTEGTLDVLKDKLSVEDLAVDTQSKKAILSYNLIDEDSSFVSGLIVMKDTENNKVKTIEISNNKNSYELPIDPYKKYSVTLEVIYDLDSDKESKENQDKLTTEPIEVELIPEYNLKITDIEITSVNNAEHKATIEFVSTNNSHYAVNSVKIGGNEYVVTPLEPASSNRYAFEYPYGEELEGKRTEIKIEEVTLKNDVKVTPSENTTALIFKEAPKVTKIVSEVLQITNIKTDFEISDNDGTLTKLYAVLKDQNGNELQPKDLNLDARTVTFDGINAGNYTVEIFADYSLVDGKEHVKEKLKVSDEIDVKPIANVKANKEPAKYANKGDTIELDYNITSNTGSLIKSVMINGVECLANNYSTGNYRISYTVPNNTFGPYNIDLTLVNFENGQSAEISGGYSKQVDILKEKPSITNFSTVDNINNQSVMVTFTINDPEGTFVSGKASLGEDVKEISKDTKSLMFNDVKLDELYTFKIEINYDLDSDSKEITNADILVFEHPVTLLSKYDLSVTNAQTYKTGENTPTKYFAKNEQVQLRFNSENKSVLRPTRVKINSDWYDVNAEENADGTVKYYYTNLTAKETPGTESLEILEIMLSTGKIITKDEFIEKPEPVTIDVLKAIPEIQEVNINNTNSKCVVTFNVVDPDSALLDSYIKVVGKENGKTILNEKISNGKNEFTIELETGVSYTLTIERNYNLDSQPDDDQNINREILITKDLEIASADFKLRNLSIPRRIPNGTTATMTFENELMSSVSVDKIVIDGTPYDVEKDANGVYSLTLTPSKIGVNTIHLDSVLMGGKEFKLSRYVSYIHEAVEPEAYDVSEISQNLVDNVAEISYKLKDPNNAIKKLTAIMKNSAGAVATTKELEDPTATSFDLPLLKTFRYTIELKAEYDIGDGKTFDTKTLFEQTHEAEGYVSLVEETIKQEFVNKGDEVVLQYKINTNVDQEVTKIVIDDISYNVEKVKDKDGKIVADTYTVTLKAPEKSGVFAQHVTAMQIGINKYKVDDKNPVEIKVLKDKPTLTHFVIDEGKGNLSFKINDPNGSLVQNPTLTITNASGKKTVKNLTKNASDYTFKLSELGITNIGETYNLIANASYDLKPQKTRNNSCNRRRRG